MSCKLCGGDLLTQVSHRDAKSSEPLNVSICRDCGLIQQVPIPTDEDLARFYAHTYRTEYKKTSTPKPKHVYRAGMAARDRLAFLASNSITDGKLLDVGAGGGEFVYLAGKNGFEASGIDPNIGYAEYAKAEYGIDIRTLQLAEVSEHCTVATMFHVMEHMPSPVATFGSLWEIIEPGGVLFVEVPNIETKSASPHNIFFKAHIHYFSKAMLAACASQHFEVITTSQSANLRILFKRRDAKAPLQLPSTSDTDHTRKRLQHKGWTEYLFAGGGIRKPCSRITKILTEAKARNKTSKAILDQLTNLR